MDIPEQQEHVPERSSVDFTLPFFLKRTAKVNMVVHLWRQAVIDNDDYAEEDKWDVYKTRVSEKIDKLPFTQVNESLRNELKELILPISKHFRTALTVFLRISNKARDGTARCLKVDILRWVQISPLGTVDFRRSARALVNTGLVNNMERYRIARLFCLDDIIQSSWNAMSQASRDSLCHQDQFSMGSPKDRLYEHYKNYQQEPLGYSNYIYAAQDLNETALRHIFSVKIPRLDNENGTMVSSDWNSTFPVQCAPDVYLFLMACYPNDINLHPSLTAQSMFLFHLFEWPYLDVFMNVVRTIVRRNRHERLHSMIHHIASPNSGVHISEPLYFNTFQMLWNVFLDADFYNFTTLPELGCDVLKLVFMSERPHGGNINSLINLMLRGESQERKELLCSNIAEKITTILENDLVGGFGHLFEVCLAEEELSEYKNEFLKSREINRTCWMLIIDEHKKIRRTAERFWTWCGLDDFELGRKKWQLTRLFK